MWIGDCAWRERGFSARSAILILCTNDLFVLIAASDAIFASLFLSASGKGEKAANCLPFPIPLPFFGAHTHSHHGHPLQRNCRQKLSASPPGTEGVHDICGAAAPSDFTSLSPSSLSLSTASSYSWQLITTTTRLQLRIHADTHAL